MSFATLAVHVPGHRSNSHANASTLFRWATKGCRAANGELVKLECVRVGTAWKSSMEAVTRFVERLTAAAVAPTPADTPTTPTPKQRQRAAERAAREASAIFRT